MANLTTIPEIPKIKNYYSARELVELIRAALLGESHPTARGIIHCHQHGGTDEVVIKDVQFLIYNDYSTMHRLLGEALTVTIQTYQP